MNKALDFPTAWALQNERGGQLAHALRCSSVPGWHPLSGPGLLCDCGALVAEWERSARGIVTRQGEDANAASVPQGLEPGP